MCRLYNTLNYPLLCRQVLPGLYVGNYQDSKDADQLERFEITHILAIHDTARRLHSVSTGNITREMLKHLHKRNFKVTITE